MNMTQGKDVRCLSCGKLLFKGHMGEGGDIEIVCCRCKTNNHLKAASLNIEPHDGHSRRQGEKYAPSYPPAR